MAGGGPRTDHAKQTTEAAQSAASASAEQAKTFAASAKIAAERAAKEVEKPKRIAWLTFFVSLFTLLAVGYQGWLLSDQVDMTKDQMRTTVMNQLYADNSRLEGLMNARDGTFQAVHATNPNCTIDSTLTPSQNAELNIIAQQFLGHYERYFLVTSALGLQTDWKNICGGSKRLLQSYCHLNERAQPILNNVSPEFKEAFETCQLPET